MGGGHCWYLFDIAFDKLLLVKAIRRSWAILTDAVSRVFVRRERSFTPLTWLQLLFYFSHLLTLKIPCGFSWFLHYFIWVFFWLFVFLQLFTCITYLHRGAASMSSFFFTPLSQDFVDPVFFFFHINKGLIILYIYRTPYIIQQKTQVLDDKLYFRLRSASKAKHVMCLMCATYRFHRLHSYPLQYKSHCMCLYDS